MRSPIFDEDDGFESFSKIKSKKPKQKFKGHQSKSGTSELWSRMIEAAERNEPIDYTPPRPNDRRQQSSPDPVPPTNPSKFVPGPNTHTIRNNQIDFDRVANIEKISSEHNGKTTYGIKFLFTGKKGLFRVVWFNTNERERDLVYNTEYNFWTTIHKENH